MKSKHPTMLVLPCSRYGCVHTSRVTFPILDSSLSCFFLKILLNVQNSFVGCLVWRWYMQKFGRFLSTREGATSMSSSLSSPSAIHSFTNAFASSMLHGYSGGPVASLNTFYFFQFPQLLSLPLPPYNFYEVGAKVAVAETDWDFLSLQPFHTSGFTACLSF